MPRKGSKNDYLQFHRSNAAGVAGPHPAYRIGREETNGEEEEVNAEGSYGLWEYALARKPEDISPRLSAALKGETES